MLNKIIDKHIDTVTGKIKKNSRTNPVKTKEEFNDILKGFKIYNRGKSGVTIGTESIGRTPLLWLSIHGKEYHLNSDTKIEGINQYYLNKGNDWKIIENLNGTKNKVTNLEGGDDIPGFYLYQKL